MGFTFNYHWGLGSSNWLFPPPHLILKSLSHLEHCKGKALILTPQWKSSPFYPKIVEFSEKYGRKIKVFDSKGVFIQGCDKTSYFGPDFNCAINVWLFDCRL